MSDRQALRFDATPDSLPALRRFIADQAHHYGWDACGLDMTIAIGEVVQNIIRHGFAGCDAVQKYIWIDAELQTPHLVWTIRDNAPPSDPLSWRRAPAICGGGYGLGLIDSIATQVEFLPTNSGNQARLWFAKTPRAV